MASIELAPLKASAISLPGSLKSAGHGLSVKQAWLFIIGEMAGVGALVYPSKLFDLFTGMVLLCFVSAVAAFSGSCLAKTWTFLAATYPKECVGCTEPYPQMVEKAFGKKGLVFSRFCVMVTLFCVASIFVMLSAGNIYKLLEVFHLTNEWWSCHCWLMLAVVIFCTPLAFLPTPKESWGLALVAAGSTIIAFFLIAFQAFKDGPMGKPANETSEWPDLVNVPGLPGSTSYFFTCSANETVVSGEVACNEKHSFTALLSVFVFGFGGMSIFPSIQIEMTNVNDFQKVVNYSMGTLVFLYSLVMVPGYLNYGSDVEDNIIANLEPTSWISITANLLMTSHLVFALVIVCNPPIQALETAFIKPGMKVQSYAMRTFYMFLILVFCTTMPKFGIVAEFVGATTVMCNTFIIPATMFLTVVRGVDLTSFKSIKHKFNREMAVSMVVVAVGVFGMTMGLRSTINAVLKGDLAPPCWWNLEGACAALKNLKVAH